MVSKPLLNKYAKLKEKVRFALVDIVFLKECRKNKVYPNFIKIKCTTYNKRTERVLVEAKNKWLKSELQYHYGRLAAIELELYSVHDLSVFEYEKWTVFCNILEEESAKKCLDKKTQAGEKIALFDGKNKNRTSHCPKICGEFCS